MFAPAELLVNVPTHGPSTHPGEMLREEFLPPLGWTAADLAARILVPQETVEELLADRIPLTPDLALRMARLFGYTPGMWFKMQLGYDLFFALRSAELERIEPLPLPDLPEELAEEPLRKAS